MPFSEQKRHPLFDAEEELRKKDEATKRREEEEYAKLRARTEDKERGEEAPWRAAQERLKTLLGKTITETELDNSGTATITFADGIKLCFAVEGPSYDGDIAFGTIKVIEP